MNFNSYCTFLKLYKWQTMASRASKSMEQFMINLEVNTIKNLLYMYF